RRDHAGVLEPRPQRPRGDAGRGTARRESPPRERRARALRARPGPGHWPGRTAAHVRAFPLGDADGNRARPRDRLPHRPRARRGHHRQERARPGHRGRGAPAPGAAARRSPHSRMKKRILVVDDEQSMRELLAIMLKKEGFEVVTAESRAVSAAVLGQGPVDMVITDVKLPDGDGIEILRHVKAASPETVVIVMTAYGSTETAVAALKLGAHDYVQKPFDVDGLKIGVRNALERQELPEENIRLKAELGRQHGLEQVIGVSPSMTALFEMVRSVAPTGSTVLITGESGTGKELVARAIHALSPRDDGPFVSVNCGALPDTLLESELFGHMKGSFTDAHQNKKGLFEAAHRGTLFLDEVGETSPSMQVKLLRALQEKKIRRVGSTEELEVDVRVISATNVPLETL